MSEKADDVMVTVILKLHRGGGQRNNWVFAEDVNAKVRGHIVAGMLDVAKHCLLQFGATHQDVSPTKE